MTSKCETDYSIQSPRFSFLRPRCALVCGISDVSEPLVRAKKPTPVAPRPISVGLTFVCSTCKQYKCSGILSTGAGPDGPDGPSFTHNLIIVRNVRIFNCFFSMWIIRARCRYQAFLFCKTHLPILTNLTLANINFLPLIEPINQQSLVFIMPNWTIDVFEWLFSILVGPNDYFMLYQVFDLRELFGWWLFLTFSSTSTF